MIERIIDVLSQNDIQNFLINENKINTEELFFIRKSLNLTRNKHVTKYEVTLYRDFSINDTLYRGSASCTLNPSMSDNEISDNIMSAYEAALSVKNPYYKLPHGNAMFTCNDTLEFSDEKSDNNASDVDLSINAMSADNRSADRIYSNYLTANDIAAALFEPDVNSDYYINSTEIFVTSTISRIINSNGINVSYKSVIYSGEFVVQCTLPSDVELYQDFKYSDKDSNISDSLRTKVIDALKMVSDRAGAIPFSSGFSYENVVLEGSCVGDLFYYYLRRLDASMIYPKYSSFEIGSKIISDVSTDSDIINITLNPKIPFSNEGIPLKELELIKDNTARYITGNARFSFYLGINPTGEYNSYKMKCGKHSLCDLKSRTYLRIVNFSDFQMDELSGQVGGEFRLAYYFDGSKEIPVTNGSISANINDIANRLLLSKESQTSYSFEGPLAISYSLK